MTPRLLTHWLGFGAELAPLGGDFSDAPSTSGGAQGFTGSAPGSGSGGVGVVEVGPAVYALLLQHVNSDTPTFE